MKNDIANELSDILVIGGGRMGQAIVRGILKIEGMSASRITVANPGKAKRDTIERELGVRTVEHAHEGMPARCVIIAVKPGKVAQVATELVQAGIDASSLVVSIAAGISTESIARILGPDVPIVRVMPNTPLICGYGMSAVSGGASAGPKDCELVCALFASMGKAVIVDESQQDIACAVSGSGPAYFELFAQKIAHAAHDLGMGYDTALELVMQTMLGTAHLIESTGQTLEEAIDAVSSPGGTTVAALDAMREHGIDEAIQSGVIAAARRSEELGA